VCTAGEKWYVLVIVDDYSRYAWVFFLADKGETFGFVRDLILRLKNERHGDVV
jgi:transposase InsO family protein